MISAHFQGKPSNITVIQAYAPTNNAEEAEAEQFHEYLQDLLEQTPPPHEKKKSTKFLNLGHPVLFNSQKYFPCSHCLPFIANFYKTWILPSPPWSGSLRVTWETVFEVWSPKCSQKIEHNSIFRLWLFLSWQWNFSFSLRPWQFGSRKFWFTYTLMFYFSFQNWAFSVLFWLRICRVGTIARQMNN